MRTRTNSSSTASRCTDARRHPQVRRNEHGMMYNAINPRTGAVPGRPGPTTGATTTTVSTRCTWWTARAEVPRGGAPCVSNLHHYQGYAWEGHSHDGYADSIEGAINLLNREPIALPLSGLTARCASCWPCSRHGWNHRRLARRRQFRAHGHYVRAVETAGRDDSAVAPGRATRRRAGRRPAESCSWRLTNRGTGDLSLIRRGTAASCTCRRTTRASISSRSGSRWKAIRRTRCVVPATLPNPMQASSCWRVFPQALRRPPTRCHYRAAQVSVHGRWRTHGEMNGGLPTREFRTAK